MKKVFILLLVAVLMISISSCEKEEVTGTRIKVLVEDDYGENAQPVSSVPVKLYTSSDDCRLRENEINSETTNSSGEVVFGDVEANKDYWVRAVTEDDFGDCGDATTIDNEEVSVTIRFL